MQPRVKTSPAPDKPAGPEPDEPNASARKRKAILNAAIDVFLKSGYLGASMDEIAALAEVSKQTVYKQFTSKESLFIDVVRSMTDDASDRVHRDFPELPENGEVSDYLEMYGFRQLSIVLTPRLMQLRRLVIGEVGRFPELARVLYERGPERAIQAFADVLKQLAKQKLLQIEDPVTAASHFNWLIMSAPLNRAMLLGDEAILKPPAMRRHVAECVAVFLAAYRG